MKIILREIAYSVLRVQLQGLSKVRFAKTLYFVHKALINEGLASPSDLAYIRMPLGPVPDGFEMLEKDPAIIVLHRETGLSYDQQLYKLRIPHERLPDAEPLFTVVKDAVAQLVRIPTSELVASSHEEPSWQQHTNGQKYHLTAADLKRPNPKSTSATVINASVDDRRLQARLIAGMLSEIVDESTALEYPNEVSE